MAEEIVGDIICRKRGDTAPDQITILDPASLTTPKAPLDITGFSYTLTVNTDKDPDPAVPIGTELASIAGVLIDPVNGVVQFPWLPAEADQAADVDFYDIEQVDATGKVKTIAKNQYKFFMDVTKIN